MAKKTNKSSQRSFFNDASLKLNREIKNERAQQVSSKQSGFMKQLNEHKTRDPDVYTKAKAQGQHDSLFRGQDVIAKDKKTEPLFQQNLDKLDPVKDTNESPQGNFQFEQRVNLIRKDVK